MIISDRLNVGSKNKSFAGAAKGRRSVDGEAMVAGNVFSNSPSLGGSAVWEKI